MNIQEMTNHEMEEALAGLLKWRDEAEPRLAEHERSLQEIREWKEAISKFEYVSEDFYDVAWALVFNLLCRDFGMNRSAENHISHDKKGQSHETGLIAFDDPAERNEIYFISITSKLDQTEIDWLLERLRAVRKLPDRNIRRRKAYGLIATTPEAPEELRERVRRQGIYLVIIEDRTIKMDVPPSFTPRVFGPPEQNGKQNGKRKKTRAK